LGHVLRRGYHAIHSRINIAVSRAKLLALEKQGRHRYFRLLAGGRRFA
jgi:hypothetical protein